MATKLVSPKLSKPLRAALAINRKKVTKECSDDYYHTLQAYVETLPTDDRNIISEALLREISDYVVRDSVFVFIVSEQKLQHECEQRLLATRGEFCRRHSEALSRVRSDSERNSLKTKQELELRNLDMKILIEIDVLVKTQQSTFEQFGVPGFQNCSIILDDEEVRRQVHVLDFIVRLSNSKCRQRVLQRLRDAGVS